MKDMMAYNNYLGSVHYSDEDRTFFGKVEQIRSLISYEGTDVESLRNAFEEAIDDYLAHCKTTGTPPEKPFKGSFNIRPGAELHRKAATYAKEKGISLNNLVSEALETYLANAK